MRARRRRRSQTAPNAPPTRPLGWLEGVIVVMGVLVAVVALRINAHTDKTFSRSVPMARVAADLKGELTLSHLWLEEYLGGDSSVDFDGEVFRPLDRAGRLCQIMLEGGEVTFGAIEAMEGMARHNVSRLCGEISRLRSLTS